MIGLLLLLILFWAIYRDWNDPDPGMNGGGLL